MAWVWEIRLSGWTNKRLIAEGKLEAYLLQLSEDKRNSIVELNVKEITE